MFSSFSSLAGRLALVAAFAVLGTCVVGCPGPIDPPLSIKNDPKPQLSAIPSTDPVANPTIATAGNLVINRSDLDSVLYEAFGTKMLFDLVELNLAKQMLEQQHMTLTQADIDAEREKILVKICGAETDRASWDNLFNQFLQQKNLTRTEFEIKIVQTRACLRKIVEPQVVGKLKEEMIHAAFDQMYGAERQIQDIRLQDLAVAAIALSKLNSGEPFEKVAQEMSSDARTAQGGGYWTPFAANNQSIPEVIRKAAFGLKVGDISEPLNVGVYVHIIKVVKVIPPKIAKYEDERDLVKNTMEQQVIDEQVSGMQGKLQQFAEANIKIDDPIIKKEWAKLLAGARGSTKDRSAVLDEMAKHHPTTLPTTEPMTAPVMGPTTGPTTAPMVETPSGASLMSPMTPIPGPARAGPLQPVIPCVRLWVDSADLFGMTGGAA
jgi:parvulin-like peptidyl-prolyl isomerase